jgi:predicted amidohydrolase YtcJ
MRFRFLAMRFGFPAVLSVLLVAAAGYGQQNAPAPPDAIFFNGKVITVDAGFSTQQAFAVKGETFVAVGNNKEIRNLAARATRVIDLGGATVMPGLTDNHDHVYDSAKIMLRGVSLDGATSLSDALARIRQAVTKARPGEPVFTSVLRLPPGQAGPTKADLDQISTDVPIVVMRGRRGGSLLNTAALRLAAITRETATFAGQPMPKDANGELTGASPAYPGSMVLVDKLLPAMTEAEEEALLLKAIQQRNALGLTSVRDLSLFPGAMRAYFRLWQKGQLTLRVSMGLDLPDAAHVEDVLRVWGVGSGFGDTWLRLDSISEDPYPLVTDARQFKEVALAANKYGWRLSPHIDGDESLNAALEAFEAADRAGSIKEKRWVLEHVPLATPEQMDRMVKLGVVVSSQYAAYGGNLAAATNAVGRTRAERQPPMRELLDHHLVVSAGSDFLGGPGSVDNPFVPIYFYVTRKTRNGEVIGPEEKISRQEALRVSTINYAFTTFEEKVKGSIEPGKLADFLILSDDILTVPEEKILAIHSLATYVGGRKVFAAEGGGF